MSEPSTFRIFEYIAHGECVPTQDARFQTIFIALPFFLFHDEIIRIRADPIGIANAIPQDTAHVRHARSH